MTHFTCYHDKKETSAEEAALTVARHAVQLRGVSMKRAVQAVLKREGWRGLYGGVGAVAMGAGSVTLLYPARTHAHKPYPC